MSIKRNKEEVFSPSRRTFLNVLLKSGFVIWSVSIFYPLYRYLKPPKDPSSKPSNVIAGKVDELEPNSGKIFKFGNKPGILIKTPQGEIRAFTAVCTHLDCTVQYREDLQHIWCACHNGHYDLNGINIAGPPPRPLEPFETKIKGNDIYVIRES